MAHEQRIAGILSETAEIHDCARRVIGAAQPDSASWYTNWLIHMSPLAELLGRTPTNGELERLLVTVDRQYTMDRPNESWESFYATAIVAQLGGHKDKIQIQEYAGDRDELRDLFVLAGRTQRYAAGPSRYCPGASLGHRGAKRSA